MLRAVHELTGGSEGALVAETPLMEAGVDSLAATELSARLRSLTGVALSPTLIFEHPTPRAIARHVLSQVVPEEEAPSIGAAGCFGMAAGSDFSVMLIDMVARWPGGCNDSASRCADGDRTH